VAVYSRLGDCRPLWESVIVGVKVRPFAFFRVRVFVSYVPKFEPVLFRNWYIDWSYSFHVRVLDRFLGNFAGSKISFLVS
jgi:hypothetical protein